MKKIDIKFVASASVVATLYVVLTYALAPLSYGAIQFRFSEALVLLVLYKKEYSIPLTIGCLIANLLSFIGLPDVIFGTLATMIALGIMVFIKNRFIASLVPAFVNGLIIGALLYYVLDLPFWLSASQVFFGEFVVVTLIGLPLFKTLEQNEVFTQIFGIPKVNNKTRFSLYTYLIFALSVVLVTFFFKLPVSKEVLEDEVLYTSVYDYTFGDKSYWLIILMITPVLNLLSIALLKPGANIIVSIILLITNLVVLSITIFMGNPPVFFSGIYILVFLLFGYISYKHTR